MPTLLSSSCERTALNTGGAFSSESMLLTSPGQVSEVSELEEQLQLERQRSAQLRATLEEREAALVQLQSTLALGGRFVTVDNPPGVSEGEGAATREEIEKLMELSARALAAKEAEIERLKSQHAKALFHQKMWFKRELLRIIPEMAHNLNRWHFSLVNRINDMLPTEAPEGGQTQRTPPIGNGSAEGTNQVQLSGPPVDQVNAPTLGNRKAPQKAVHSRMAPQYLTPPRETVAIDHKKRSPAKKAISKKKAASEKEEQAKSQKGGRGMSKKVTKKGVNAVPSFDMQLSPATGTRKSSRKRDKTTTIKEFKKDEPPAKKVKRYHELVQGKQVETPNIQTKKQGKAKQAAKPLQKATKNSCPPSVKSPKKVGGLGSVQKKGIDGPEDKDLRTNWGTELLMTPHFVPECNFARLDRGDSVPGVEKTILTEAGDDVEERSRGVDTAEVQEGAPEKGETDVPAAERAGELPASEQQIGKGALENGEAGKESEAPVEEPGKEKESWQDAEECPTESLETAQDQVKRSATPIETAQDKENKSESPQRKREASGERSPPLESEGPEDVEKFSEEATGQIERQPRFKRLKKAADRKASPVCQAEANLEPENDRDGLPPTSEASLGRKESAQEKELANSSEKTAEEKDAPSKEVSIHEASPEGTKDALKAGTPELTAESAPSNEAPRLEATPKTTAETESAQENDRPTLKDFDAKLRERVRCLRRGLRKEETFGWLVQKEEGKKKAGPCWILCECTACCEKGDRATVPLTPPEFERHAGCARKNWRASITFVDSGKCLREELGDVPLQRAQKRV